MFSAPDPPCRFFTNPLIYNRIFIVRIFAPTPFSPGKRIVIPRKIFPTERTKKRRRIARSFHLQYLRNRQSGDGTRFRLYFFTFTTMDAFIPYFSDGAWYLAHRASISLLVFLVLLFFVYRLSDYRRGIFLSLIFALALALGMVLSCAGLLGIRGTTAAFVFPALATLLAIFNIFGAGVRPSAILEKTGFVCALLFALTLGLTIGKGYGSADGTILPLTGFVLGMTVGLLAMALIALCVSSLVSFFGVNRRDFTMVVSAIAIGLLLPLLIRHFPFTLR